MVKWLPVPGSEAVCSWLTSASSSSIQAKVHKTRPAPTGQCWTACWTEVGVDLGFHTTFPKPCPDWWADGKRHGYRYDQISVAYNPFLDGLAETRAVRRVSFSSPHPITDFSLPAEVLRTGRRPFGTSVAGLERALVASSGFTSLWARYSTKGTSTSRTPPQALFVLAGEVSSNLGTFPIPRILRTTFIALTQILDISHLASGISPLHLNRSYYTSRWAVYCIISSARVRRSYLSKALWNAFRQQHTASGPSNCPDCS